MPLDAFREEKRLEALEALGILDTPEEAAFDDLTHLAAQICGTPTALITLVAENRQWFKSRVGFDTRETSRAVSFCDHTIRDEALMEIPDAARDDRFRENPLVTGEPGIRFYAGTPLVTPDGHRLGALCVIDYRPGGLDDPQREALKRLGRQVVHLLDLRRQHNAMSREVETRKRIELALLESQERFELIFEKDPVATSLSDLDTGAFIDVNETFAEMMGMAREKLIGRTSIELGLWGEDPASRNRLREVLVEGGGFRNLERTIPRPDGTKVIVGASAALVHLDGKQCVLSTFQDITERKRLEAEITSFNEDLERRVDERSRELARSERRYRTLVEVSPDAIFLHEAGRITFVNPAMVKLLRAKGPEQLLGKNLMSFVHPDFADIVRQRIEQTQAGDPAPAMPQRIIRMDGTEAEVEVIGTSFEENGHTVSQVVMRDLTDRMLAERQTSQLRARNSQLVAALGEIVYDWRPQENRIEWDGDYTRILGYAAGEMGSIKESWADKVHPDDFPRTEQEVGAALEEGRLFDLEYRFRRKDGSYVWLHDRGVLEKDAEGRLERSLGILRDVTRRKRVEEALQKSERFATASMDALSAHVAILDKDGYIIATNRSWKEFGEANGLDPVWNEPSANYLSVCDAAAKRGFGEAGEAAEGIRKVLAGSLETFTLEYPCHGPANEQWFLSKVTRMAPDDDRVVVAHENITEVKLAEARLRDQQELNRLTLENLAEGVVACDANGNLFLFNKTARDWHGADPMRVPQEEWAKYYDLYEGDGVTPLVLERIPLIRAFNGERVRNAEMSIVRKGSKPRFVLASGEPIMDDRGEKQGAVVVMHDQTERRESDRIIRQSLEEKETLLKEIHHRVKNNLQVVSSLLDMQSAAESDSELQMPLLESINRIRSMSMIHEQLYQSASLARIHLGEYTEKLCRSLLRSYAQRQHVDLEIETDDVEVNIETAVPCGLILNELVSNAFKHAFEPGSEGTLSVSVGEGEDGGLRLVVKDDGRGLPVDFDPDRSASLGLQLVKTLTYQLKGNLTVTNENGARFVLDFRELKYEEIG